MRNIAIGDLDESDPVRVARVLKRRLSQCHPIELWHDANGLLWTRRIPGGVMIGLYDDAIRVRQIADDIDCARAQWERLEAANDR